MIYSSLQVKFQGTKHKGRIQRYGASIFGDIIIKVTKSINKEKQVFWRNICSCHTYILYTALVTSY